MVKTKCIYKSKEIIENLYEGYCQLNDNHSNKECSQSVNSTKALMARKAIIAMSGGVDSSVAAFIIKEAGYECMGATMRLYNNEDAGISKGNTCCSLDDIEDARSVAFRIGIPYRVFNFMSDFKENVIDRFI
jgi:predicted PP-loop superfamily ATPase